MLVHGQTVKSVVLDILGIKNSFENLMKTMDPFSFQIDLQIHAHTCIYTNAQSVVKLSLKPLVKNAQCTQMFKA